MNTVIFYQINTIKYAGKSIIEMGILKLLSLVGATLLACMMAVAFIIGLPFIILFKAMH